MQRVLLTAIVGVMSAGMMFAPIVAAARRSK